MSSVCCCPRDPDRSEFLSSLCLFLLFRRLSLFLPFAVSKFGISRSVSKAPARANARSDVRPKVPVSFLVIFQRAGIHARYNKRLVRAAISMSVQVFLHTVQQLQQSCLRCQPVQLYCSICLFQYFRGFFMLSR